MFKARFLNGPFGEKSPLVILVLVLLLLASLPKVAPSQEIGSEEQKKVVRKLAQKWIQDGMAQYSRSFFKLAEQSFLRAQEYKDYFTADENKKLSELLEQTHLAVLERQRILEHIQTADLLVQQGDLTKAKAHLEQVKDNKYLTDAERKQITEGLGKFIKPSGTKTKEIVDLYSSSVSLYNAGQLEKALEGFIKVARSGVFVASAGKTADDYIKLITDKMKARARDEKLTRPPVTNQEQWKPVVINKPVTEYVTEPVTTPVAEPVSNVGSSYIQKVNRKRDIRRSYTRVVVNDANAKAQDYLTDYEFDKAKEVVEAAQRTVYENELDLGELLYRQYESQLKDIADEIVLREDERTKQLEQEKRIAAMKAAQDRKTQMEADRKKRIEDLMESAMACQGQMRYEEALGQLNSLLALDPQNNNALILKQTLEDTVTFRKQLEVLKKRDKERANILRKTDEAAIPYAEELTYSSKWAEIIASPFRKPEEPLGLDPIDKEVYKQLDEIVDLSALTPEMPFSEAIEQLKNSVEPPLKIIVLWRDLSETANIEPDTELNMDGIPAIPLGTGLENILKAVSGGFAELDYVVQSGVITIATVESLPSKLVTRVYDVTYLLGQPAYFTRGLLGGGMMGGGMMGGGMMGGGMMGGYMTGGGMMGGMMGGQIDFGRQYRGDNLMLLIEDTVEPDSWWDAGGEGTITVYEGKKLIVLQTREVHSEIETLLNEMRKSLGHQVAIEARFLVVTENFLEDIGLDVDFTFDFGGKLSPIQFRQGTLGAVVPEITKVPGSLAGIDAGMEIGGGGINGYATYGNILDDLQVSFLVRATQAHTDATTLTAPKITVLSGETATFQIQRDISYALPPTVLGSGVGTGLGTSGGGYPGYPGGGGGGSSSVIQNVQRIPAGTTLTITPTINPDKRYVLLNITTFLQDLLRLKTHEVEAVIPGQAGSPTTRVPYRIEVPETESSSVQTRVSVPDQGTLLLGGQRISAEIIKEAGVPILSKIPLLGILFSNRTKVKDHKILLILVKPTILLQEEREQEAIAAMEN